MNKPLKILEHPCTAQTEAPSQETWLGKRHEGKTDQKRDFRSAARSLGFNTQEADHLHRLYVDIPDLLGTKERKD